MGVVPHTSNTASRDKQDALDGNAEATHDGVSLAGDDGQEGGSEGLGSEAIEEYEELGSEEEEQSDAQNSLVDIIPVIEAGEVKGNSELKPEEIRKSRH